MKEWAFDAQKNVNYEKEGRRFERKKNADK